MYSKEVAQARFREDLRLRGRSPKTIHDYELYLQKFLDYTDCPIEELSEENIREYVTFLLDQRKLNPNSINAYRAALIFFYNVTLDRSVSLLKLPRFKRYHPIPEILTEAELGCLLENTDNIKHLCFFLLGYGSGLRADEVASLRVCDIDSNGMRVFVNRGKGSKDRYTILSSRCLSTLREYWKMKRPGRDSDWLFPGQHDAGHLDADSVGCAYRAWRNRLGLNPNTSFHSLRHGFATKLLENGVGLYQIKELMGHSSLASTMVYLHLSNVSRDITSPADQGSSYAG